jgi:5,10-methylene-tetrahydrofolate dehydrogenase/methenyl tetrahydrofolate cyclohydrolase
MLAVKQAALNTINKLPEDADIDEIMYQLYVVDKIQKAQQAIEQQRVLSSEELKREIDSW